MLLPIILIAGGYMVYQHSKTAVNTTPNAVPSVKNNQTTQPSQKYPFTPPPSARVDNTSQPWYGGSQLFQKASSALPAGLVSAANPSALNNTSGLTVAAQATNLWKGLDAGSWFTSSSDGSDETADVNTADNTVSYDQVDYGSADQTGTDSGLENA